MRLFGSAGSRTARAPGWHPEPSTPRRGAMLGGGRRTPTPARSTLGLGAMTTLGSITPELGVLGDVVTPKARLLGAAVAGSQTTVLGMYFFFLIF